MRHLIVAILAATAAAAAQTPPPAPAFEVASIKPNKSGDGRFGIGMQPGGRFAATGIPLRQLIAMAYGSPGQPLPAFRIIGGPAWMNSDRFDIVAKAEGDIQPGSNSPLPLMLRALLADRFKLVVHNESRELPIYALMKARRDGKLGPQLRPTTVDCAALAAARGRDGGPPPDGPGVGPAGRPTCGMTVGPGSLAAGGQTMAQFAALHGGRAWVEDNPGGGASFRVFLPAKPAS